MSWSLKLCDGGDDNDGDGDVGEYDDNDERSHDYIDDNLGDRE